MLQHILNNIGSKMEVDGSWRKWHNGELHNLYYSPNIIKVIELGVTYGRHGGEERCLQGFGGVARR
jgi:hypothetical protein